MSDLQVKGKQTFMDREIPVVLGGFGEGKRCISDKTIAEIHDVTTSDIRKMTIRNMNRFTVGVDVLDLKRSSSDDDLDKLLQTLGYSKQQTVQAEHIYIYSERGYAKLIKTMDSDLAWEIHDKLIDEYFTLRNEKEQMNLNNLSPQLQLLINLELQQRQIQTQITQVNQRVDGIKEIVGLSVVGWRESARALIVKIAEKWGGHEYISEVNKTIYKELDSRLGVNLKQRRTNKRHRMADEGVSKSKQDKISYVDVIADDKKLIEGYMAIIKELAVVAGVADVEEEDNYCAVR